MTIVLGKYDINYLRIWEFLNEDFKFFNIKRIVPKYKIIQSISLGKHELLEFPGIFSLLELTLALKCRAVEGYKTECLQISK